MRLVDYKGTLETPGELSFGAQFNLIVTKGIDRGELIRQIINAMPLDAHDVDFDLADAVITSADLEWIVAATARTPKPRLMFEPQTQQLDDEQVQAQLARLSARELELRDALIRAESDRELVANELARIEEEESYRTSTAEQREAREAELIERISELEDEVNQPIVDMHELRARLEGTDWTQPWENLDAIYDLRDELADLAERSDEELNAELPSQESQEVDEHPTQQIPQWLVIQLETDLASAQRDLDMVRADYEGREPNGLEMGLEAQALKRVEDAHIALDELFGFVTKDEETGEAVIPKRKPEAIFGEVKELFGLETDNAAEACEFVSGYIEKCEQGTDYAILIDEMQRLGIELSEQDDPVQVATELVNEFREAEIAKERGTRELARARDELENLRTWDEPAQYTAEQVRAFLEKAEQRLVTARNKYRDETQVINRVRSDLTTQHDSQAVSQATEGGVDEADVFANLVEATQTVEQVAHTALPMLIDSAFDDCEPVDRYGLFNAACRLAESNQVLYFTENEDVIAWADSVACDEANADEFRVHRFDI